MKKLAVILVILSLAAFVIPAGADNDWMVGKWSMYKGSTFETGEYHEFSLIRRHMKWISI